jgi:HAD superfamily hydrolase (TIGR01509 family)
VISCVLFDSDGTLVDSEGVAAQALSVKFRELGCEVAPEELLQRFSGWQLSEQLELMSRENAVRLPGDFVAGYRALLLELLQRDLQAIHGVADVLAVLEQSVAVVSNGPRNKVELALRVCSLSAHFGDNIFSAYDLQVWKPDPAIYIRAAAGMGFAAENCAVVEDTLIGVEAGVKAGMRTLFYNPAGEDCPFAEAISFRHMSELPSLLRC